MVSPDYVELSIFAGSAWPGVNVITASLPRFYKGKVLNTDLALDGKRFIGGRLAALISNGLLIWKIALSDSAR